MGLSGSKVGLSALCLDPAEAQGLRTVHKENNTNTVEEDGRRPRWVQWVFILVAPPPESNLLGSIRPGQYLHLALACEKSCSSNPQIFSRSPRIRPLSREPSAPTGEPRKMAKGAPCWPPEAGSGQGRGDQRGRCKHQLYGSGMKNVIGCGGLSDIARVVLQSGTNHKHRGPTRWGCKWCLFR